MAHFAKLDSNSRVIDIQKVNDEVILENGIENELLGQDFLRNLFNEPNAIWKQTSYNTRGGVNSRGRTPIRKNYAIINGTYDDIKDAFIEPKPYSSWVLDDTTCLWKAPIDKPNLTEEEQQQNDAGSHFWYYLWDEEDGVWDLKNGIKAK